MNAPSAKAPPFRLGFLAPQYWPAWLGIGLLRLLCLLPLPWMVRFGEGLGGLVGRAWKKRRHIVRVNLSLCFPDLRGEALEHEIDAHFRALGAGLFEACYAWWASDARLRPHGEVVGLDHLDRAMANGTGALLLTGHFTTMELAARFIVMAGRPFHPMYRPADNALVDYLMHHWREGRAGLPALPRDDLRGLVRALRAGRAIWYGPDQTLNPRHSVFAPFFGVPALTVTATARLAEMGRAKVVPYFPQRVNGRYRVTFLPALENFPAGDEAADAARINQAIEQGIGLARSQYFWVHRRFKARPPGQQDVYAAG